MGQNDDRALPPEGPEIPDFGALLSEASPALSQSPDIAEDVSVNPEPVTGGLPTGSSDSSADEVVAWTVPELDASLASRPRYRLFSPEQAGLAGLLGGPLGGASVTAISLWRLDRRFMAFLAILAGFGWLALPAGSHALPIPIPERAASLFGWAINSLFSYLLAKGLFGKAYAAFLRDRGTRASGLAAASLGLGGAGVAMVALAGISGWESMTQAGYGTELSVARGQTIYYRGVVDRQLALRVGGELLSDEALGREHEWAAQIGREEENYWLSLIVEPFSVPDNYENRRAFTDLGERISASVLDHRLASVRLCDEMFRPWATLPIVDDRKWQQLHDAAGGLADKGRLEEAEAAYRSAVREAETFGDADYRLVISLNNVGYSCSRLGKYAEAEAALRRALQLGERALGRKSFEVGYALDALAQVYRRQGQNGEAEQLLRRALEAREQNPGTASADLVATLARLGELLVDQGRYGEAEDLQRRVLAIDERSLAADDPTVVHATANLAVTCHAQQKLEEAEPLYRRALASLESTRGAGDLLTVWVRQRLAMLCAARQRGKEAEELYCKSAAALAEAQGEEHPVVADALSALGGFYMARGRFTEAAPLFRRVASIREKALGSEDPRLAEALQNLAALVDAQGDVAESIALFERSLEIIEKSFGPEHPWLIGTLEQYAAVLSKAKRTADAEAARKRAAQIREQWIKSRPEALPTGGAVG